MCRVFLLISLWSVFCINAVASSCDPPTTVNNAQVDIDRSKQEYVEGDLLVYTCNPGYELVGSNVVTCQQNYQWSDFPVCELVDSCAEWLKRGLTDSGVYSIIPYDNKVLQVYCDQETDGGGWEVFQKRVDSAVSFYRDWDSYVEGFGDIGGSYWLGLENVHRITSRSEEYVLRVDLTDAADVHRYAEYNDFWISSAADEYKLNFESFKGGSAGNSLSYHKGLKFTTYDRDNDRHSTANCARNHVGAWWYSACINSNLNGIKDLGDINPHLFGISWLTFHGLNYSHKTAEMKFRRVSDS